LADSYTYEHLFGGKWQRFPFSLIRLARRIGARVIRGAKSVIA
jgi:hypothetical protein